MMETVTFSDYLQAKRALDDRSINPRVMQTLAEVCPASPRILDVGCGSASMLGRLMGAGVVRASAARPARYLGLDRDAELVHLARAHLAAAAHQLPTVEANVLCADVPADLDSIENGWSLITAHAFLDLVDVDRALDLLLPKLSPGGLVYFSLNFDDVTIMEPPVLGSPDEPILEAYHQSMYSERWGGSGGHPRTGRKLFHALRERGMEVLDLGPSDWVIAPIAGDYRPGERVVLQFLLPHIERVVRQTGRIPAAALDFWFAARMQQIEHAELIYIAHQLDILARRIERPRSSSD